MKQRVLTGAGIIAFLVLLFFTKASTTYLFDAFIVMISILAGIEMSKLLTKFNYYNSKITIILYPVLAYAVFKFGVYKQLSLQVLIVLQVALLILMAGIVSLISLLAKKRTDNEIKTRKLTNISTERFSLYKGIQTLFGLLYPGFILTALLYINNLQKMYYAFPSISGVGFYVSLFFMTYVFVIPMFVDTFAMLTGSIFKGKKLCPKVSPNKTISGAIGGIVWGVICGVALYFTFNSIDIFRKIFIDINLKWWMVLIATFVSTIVCQIGDIFESYLKRKADVKDSGDILPGHGGILDRIDSHLANMLVAFVFMLLVI